MKMKWKSALAIFCLISGCLSAAILPVPAISGNTFFGAFEVGVLPGLAFGLAVYVFLFFFEKTKRSAGRALIWILAAAGSSFFASLFTSISTVDGSPLLAFPTAVYFLSGAIAAFFIAIGFRVFLPLTTKQSALLLALGGILSLAGVWLVQYLNLDPASWLPNFLFFEIWQVGMAFALEGILNYRKHAAAAAPGATS